MLTHWSYVFLALTHRYVALWRHMASQNVINGSIGYSLSPRQCSSNKMHFNVSSAKMAAILSRPQCVKLTPNQNFFQWNAFESVACKMFVDVVIYIFRGNSMNTCPYGRVSSRVYGGQNTVVFGNSLASGVSNPIALHIDNWLVSDVTTVIADLSTICFDFMQKRHTVKPLIQVAPKPKT